jgi:uncharacterized membrane protein YqjE
LNNAPSGLFSSLRGFAATSVALLRTRLGLLKVEAEEEVNRILGLALWGVAAVLLGIVGLVFLAVFLTVLLWDSQRLLALGIFTTLFLGMAGVAIASALRLAQQGSLLFTASLAELRRDAEALDKHPPAP